MVKNLKKWAGANYLGLVPATTRAAFPSGTGGSRVFGNAGLY